MAAPGKGPLRIAIEDFISTAKISDTLSAGMGHIFVNASKGLAGAAYAFVVKAGVQPFLASVLPGNWIQGGVIEHPSEFAVILESFLVTIWSLVAGWEAPVTRLANYKAEKAFSSARVPVGDAIRGFWRDPAFGAILSSDVGEQGWDTDRIHIMTELARARADIGILHVNLERGLISEAQFTDELTRRGYLPEDISYFLNASDNVPGPGDQLRFAMTGAWDQSIVNVLALDDELPTDYVTWMKANGFDANWARLYWRSHWSMPNLSDGFEMLHRLRPGRTRFPFTAADLDLLFKANGVPAAYRSRLQELAYSPIPRIAINALYAAGLVTQDTVYQNYLDLGFDADRADIMTRYTIHQGKAAEKGVTQSTISQDYDAGLVSRDEALAGLIDIGISPDDAELTLARVDHANAASVLNIRLSAIQTQFVNFQVDESGVMSLLGPLNLSTDRVNALLSQWNAQRVNKTFIPSVSQLTAFYEAGSMTTDEIKTALKQRGYTDRDATLQVQQIVAAARKAAKADQDAAQAALDRENASKARTALTLQQAQLTLKIAQLQASIADINVAITDPTADPATVASLKTYIPIIKSQIAEIVVQKAQLTVGATGGTPTPSK